MPRTGCCRMSLPGNASSASQGIFSLASVTTVQQKQNKTKFVPADQFKHTFNTFSRQFSQDQQPMCNAWLNERMKVPPSVVSAGKSCLIDNTCQLQELESQVAHFVVPEEQVFAETSGETLNLSLYHSYHLSLFLVKLSTKHRALLRSVYFSHSTCPHISCAAPELPLFMHIAPEITDLLRYSFFLRVSYCLVSTV